MADDLRVRVIWQNDEASLRAAMQQAQQILQSVTGNAGAGTVAGVPTPAALAAAGAIRAQSPNNLLNAQGQPIGTTTQPIVAPPPAYQPNQPPAPNPPGPNPNPPNQPNQAKPPKGRMSGVLGYFGRSILVREAFSAFGAIGEAAQQQQQLSDMNRRVGEGTQKWRDFEDQVLKVGVGLGATRQQMIELTNTFVSSAGKMSSPQQLAGTMRGGMELAKTMGIAPESVVGFMGNEAKFNQGGNTDFGKLGAVLYTAVQAGMQGREEEVIAAIEGLTDLMGKRLPDFGPSGIGGIGEVMRAFSATGIQGLMGQRGGEKIGTVDQFISGGGTEWQNMVRMTFAAQEAKAEGLPTDPLSLTRALEGGLNEPFGQAVAKRISGQMPGGLAGSALLSSIMGLGGIRNAEAVSQGISGINIGATATTPPGVDLTKADTNTEAMVSLNRAFQKLGEEVLPAVVAADNMLAGEITGLAGLLSHTNGLLSTLGSAIAILGPILGGLSLAGINPLATAGKAIAATGVGSAVGGAASAAAPLALVPAAGLALGGLGSLIIDKMSHPNEPTTLDMLMQIWGISGLPGQAKIGAHAKGGIVNGPEVALIGEDGPEAIVPLNPSDKSSLRALARSIATAYGLDPDIFERQINQESGFNYRALGDSGQSYGLGQINRPSHPDYFGSGDPYDPTKNLDYAAALLRGQLGIYGDYRDALAAYNAGGGNIGAGYGYADKILGGSNVFSNVSGSMPAAGGFSSGQVVNHHLTVTVKQPDGSTENYAIDLNSPYRNVLTTPNWGVAY